MKKIIITVGIMLLLCAFGAQVIHAAPVTLTTGDLELTVDQPMFPATDVWYPGLTETKTLNIKNIGTSTHTPVITTINTSQTHGMADILDLQIFENSIEKFGIGVAHQMSDFWNNGQITFSPLDSGRSTDIKFLVSMPTSAGNEYQGAQAIFDLKIGFEGTSDQIIVGSGGGTSGGTSSYSCSDTKPGSAPSLIQAIPGVNSVTLIWTEGNGPLTYYLVAFGLAPGDERFGNPNIGGKGTTSFTINGLSGNQTYYFRVRAGNGCMPGDYSNELSAILQGATLSSLPSGFSQGVLGVATGSAALVTPKTPSPPGTGRKSVLGSSTSSYRIIWLLIAATIIELFIILLLLRKRKSQHSQE